MAGRNGIRIGLALGDQEITGVILGKKGSPSARVPVSVDPDGKDIGEDLLRALSDLKAQLEEGTGASTDGASAYTALLPPLADARLVSLPPMRKSEVEAVLTRDVARYFLGANRPRVVGIRMPRGNGNGTRGADGSSISVLATAAPLWLLEAVRAALETVGWRVAAFSAAHGAWLQAAASVKGSDMTSVAALVGTTAHILRLEGGNPVAVRQIPAVDADAIVEVAGPGRILVFSGPQDFEALRSILTGAGLSVSRDPQGWPGTEEGTAGWSEASRVELVPPTLAGERREKGRRTSAGLAVGAAVLILGSLVASLWGAHRELRAVQARRAAIEAQVAPLLEARDSLEGLRTQVQSLEGLSRNSPVWTRSLVALAAVLPSDTYLTGLFASGDTVEIEAAGAEAGEAIQALRSGGLFQEVRLLGLVERELEEGETVVERFRLWARLPDAEGEVDER